MPEASIPVSGMATATSVVIDFTDTATYPQLRVLENSLPVDFIQILGDGALSFYINQDANRLVPLYAAGSVELGGIKARSVRVANASGANRAFTLRLVCR